MIAYIFSILGLTYISLMITAYPHAKKGQGIVVAGPWWCLYKSSYKESVGNLCTFGRIILGLDLILLTYIYL
ncbi:hypothetical protein SAMN03159391_00608 [Pseudomonas sp. NFACC37-1]|nr:hypothetical protein SAMN03159391_00608 [Pseudomonas sp. NFACC37-1]SDB55405.1 hypothetical protein SAMN03159386_04268 [Pseudomonas sp. NFACC17-2]SEJ76521.1 hypothetical protein SAMN03159382_04249 [Pseudomonas sp. NFACC23-1]SFN78605.1 hypothetical protein SAMN03159304_01045 [Pseudomonas sp. NFACC24-1]SFW88076.1 hypothetical protein SAMN05660640_04760 [Pseudomonas sp. NFACC16-2]